MIADILGNRPAWFVLGPLIGLVIVGLFATINERIGALGGFSTIVERATGRVDAIDWRLGFLAGIFLGAIILRALGGGPDPVGGGFGWLSRAFGSDLVVAAVLLLGGGLIGFGAKTAGGCTSGNGLGGCSTGSPAGFAATATFMGTAIVVSFAIEALV